MRRNHIGSISILLVCFSAVVFLISLYRPPVPAAQAASPITFGHVRLLADSSPHQGVTLGPYFFFAGQIEGFLDGLWRSNGVPGNTILLKRFTAPVGSFAAGSHTVAPQVTLPD